MLSLRCSSILNKGVVEEAGDPGRSECDGTYRLCQNLPQARRLMVDRV